MTYTPPKDYYKAYVPKGRSGWNTFAESLSRGATQFASQWVAIKQYEAEKEAARQKAEQERLEKLAKQQWEEYKFGEQQRIREEDLVVRKQLADSLSGYREFQKTNKAEMTPYQQESIKIRWYNALKKTMPVTELDKVESDLGHTLASNLKAAIESGDQKKLRVIRNNIRYYGTSGRFSQVTPQTVTDAAGNPRTVSKVIGNDDYRILLNAVDAVLGSEAVAEESKILDKASDIKRRIVQIRGMATSDEVKESLLNALYETYIDDPDVDLDEIINDLDQRR